jgi:hypothetical protein
LKVENEEETEKEKNVEAQTQFSFQATQISACLSELLKGVSKN